MSENIPRTDRKKDLLRFVTCGSVDDGKSTLIGRLLYEAGQVLEDQQSALESDSRRYGTMGDATDYALLLDGLEAEREQGITIDVAYRFFSTERRRFIVADSPGHEQYTRNTATAASTADVAVLLIDARHGVVAQSRRHSVILSLLGIDRVILAVNKMDLVGWNEETFEAISAAYRSFAEELGIGTVTTIPVSARTGENVTTSSGAMTWYDGPTLLECLERMNSSDDERESPFRMPVQLVCRPDSDFRGYGGTLVGGSVRPGDSVSVSPHGGSSKVARIVTADGDLPVASRGQAVVLTLEDEIDIARGHVLSASNSLPDVADQAAVHLIWMHKEAMLPGRTYVLRTGTCMIQAEVTEIKYRLNIDNLSHEAAKSLSLNEIGFCNLAFDQPIALEAYDQSRELGSFILIDRFSNETVGAGMIRFPLRRASNLKWQTLTVGKASRAAIKKQSPCVLWFTGLSGAGKSTIADLVEQRLHGFGYHTFMLDGDNVRHGLNRDLGFTDVDRVENIRRIAEASKLFVDAGLIVLVSFISPFMSERRMARELLEDGEFFEIFVDTPLAECERRDPKGLYRKVREGKLVNFTGIDSVYEPPEKPEIVIDTLGMAPEEAAEQIIAVLRDSKKI